MAILSKTTTIGGKKPLLILDDSLSNNIDLNNCVEEGIYIFNNLKTAINFPNGYSWINENASHLQVFIFDKNNSSKVMQILARNNSNHLFIRYSYLSESTILWSEWTIIGNSSEFSDDVARLQYYGDKDIIPSDENYFTVNDTRETITGLTDEGKTQTELVIPYKINGVLITTIETGAFYGKSIETVIIPNSIIDMHSNIFSACYSLKSINIPNRITKIEAGMFRWCESLNTINLPNTIQIIDSSAFENCTSLTSITIPKTVTFIADNAFENCPNLTIYCEQGSTADTFAQENNIPVVYTDVKQLSAHRNYALKTKDDIPTDIQAGDICFIWNQYKSQSDIDSFAAVQYTNMNIGNSIPDNGEEYYGLTISESKAGADMEGGSIISADMEVAKEPSGTKIFFNKIS